MEFKLNEYHRNVPDRELLNDLLRVAKLLNQKSLTSEEYSKYGKYNVSTICRRFSKWLIAVKIVGLAPKPRDIHKITDEELFQDIERVWIKLGRQPTMTDVRNGEFKYSQNTFARRFGGWRRTLEAFVSFINSNDEEIDKLSKEKTIPNSIEKNKDIATHSSESKKHSTIKKHKTRRDINLRLRFKVMARDNFKCCICGRSPSTTPGLELVIDHIYPWVKGGESTMDNLQTLCKECNSGKSDLVLSAKEKPINNNQ